LLFSPTSCFRKKAVGMKQESSGGKNLNP